MPAWPPIVRLTGDSSTRTWGAAGACADDRGHVSTDDALATTAPGICVAMATGMFTGRLAAATNAYPTWSYGVQLVAAPFFMRIGGRSAQLIDKRSESRSWALFPPSDRELCVPGHRTPPRALPTVGPTSGDGRHES